jgi:hypothetical protein
METTKRSPVLWLASLSLFLVLALLLAAGSTAGQPPATSPSAMLYTDNIIASADTYVDTWYPNENYGGSDHLFETYQHDDPYPTRGRWSYLRFDFAGVLPDNAVIDSALLVLYCYETWSWEGHDVTIRSYRVTSPWNENTLTANSLPSRGEAGGSRTMAFGVTGEKVWVITDIARIWYADPAHNYGVTLQGPTSGDAWVDAGFRSSEYSSNKPRLEVTWHYAPTSTPTRTPTRTPTLTRTRTPTRTPTPGGPTATPTRTRTPGGSSHTTYLPVVMKQHMALGTTIFYDHFNSGSITGWTPHNGIWTNPGTYMRGEYAAGEAWNIKNVTGTNFAYEARVNILSGDGAGLVFRSSDTGSSSYEVVLDAAGGALQIQRRSPTQVLASIPVAVQRNHQYRLRAVASGNALEAWLDGEKRLTATDSTFGGGKFGVIVWRGVAAYDDVRAWSLP